MVDDLIEQMKVEVLTLKGKQQREMFSMIKKLDALNTPDADKSEIEKIIAGAMRSFSVVSSYDFPGVAIGYKDKPSRSGKNKLD